MRFVVLLIALYVGDEWVPVEIPIVQIEKPQPPPKPRPQPYYYPRPYCPPFG